MSLAIPVSYNNLTAMAVLCLIIANITIGHKFISRTSKYMIMLCVSIILVLLSDTISRILIETDNPYKIPWVYITSFLFFLFTAVPAVSWLLYIDSYMTSGEFNLRRRWFFTIPAIISLIVMIISIFNGFIFYVDETGGYHRGPGLFFFHVINYIPFAVAMALIIKKREHITIRLIRIVLLFAILPFISAQIQFLQPAAAILWPVVALCALMTYIFLEVQHVIRDHLTGIYNRQQFDAMVRTRFLKCRSQGPFTLLLIDLNDFKDINDSLGHETGDDALKTAARILSGSIHASDTVARIGGDEFVIILEETDARNTRAIIDRIIYNVEKTNKSGEHPYRLSLSFGSAVATGEPGCSYKSVFNKADEQMYEYKRRLKADPA